MESGEVVFLDQDTPQRAKLARVELLIPDSESNIDNVENKTSIQTDLNLNSGTPVTSEPRRSGRNVNTPAYLNDYFVFLGEVYQKTQFLEEEPKTFREAMACAESKLWMAAMQEELKSMEKNQVWELVDLPHDRKPIGSKWIFKRKFNASGYVGKYKARLVAKGYTQREGIDFVETFSPVAKFTSIRIISALTAYFDLELHQMDVKLHS